MINIISLLKLLKDKKDSFKKLNDKRKNDIEVDKYLSNYNIVLSGKYITNHKHNITFSFENESEIIGKILLIEYTIRFIELSKEYEELAKKKFSRLRKKDPEI